MRTVLELRYNDTNDTVEVLYPDCKDLDSYIQNQVEPRNRVWSKVSKCWVIVPDILESVACMGSEHFDEIKYHSLPVALQGIVKRALDYQNFTPTSDDLTPVGRGGHSKLFVTPDAPDFVVKAVYKALALHYHPDNLETGDAGTFQEIAAAYKNIKT